jgi:hypothetical protein
MFVCRWHLDIPYGNQGEALAVTRVWGAEKFASSEHWVVYRVLDERPS